MIAKMISGKVSQFKKLLIEVMRDYTSGYNQMVAVRFRGSPSYNLRSLFKGKFGNMTGGFNTDCVESYIEVNDWFLISLVFHPSQEMHMMTITALDAKANGVEAEIRRFLKYRNVICNDYDTSRAHLRLYQFVDGKPSYVWAPAFNALDNSWDYRRAIEFCGMGAICLGEQLMTEADSEQEHDFAVDYSSLVIEFCQFVQSFADTEKRMLSGLITDHVQGVRRLPSCAP